VHKQLYDLRPDFFLLQLITITHRLIGIALGIYKKGLCQALTKTKSRLCGIGNNEAL